MAETRPLCNPLIKRTPIVMAHVWPTDHSLSELNQSKLVVHWIAHACPLQDKKVLNNWYLQFAVRSLVYTTIPFCNEFDFVKYEPLVAVPGWRWVFINFPS